MTKNTDLKKRGYDYAAGALLRGETTAEELEVQAANPFDANAFDEGMIEAIRAFRLLRDSSLELPQPKAAER